MFAITLSFGRGREQQRPRQWREQIGSEPASAPKGTLGNQRQLSQRGGKAISVGTTCAMRTSAASRRVGGGDRAAVQECVFRSGLWSVQRGVVTGPDPRRPQEYPAARGADRLASAAIVDEVRPRRSLYGLTYTAAVEI
jgi:hypothetical protein